MGSGLLTPGHLVVLAIVALLVFGPKRLPELGRSLGSGLRGFKDAIEGDGDRLASAGDAQAPARDSRGELEAPTAPAVAEPPTGQQPAPDSTS